MTAKYRSDIETTGNITAQGKLSAGALSLPDGSASAPALTNIGDTNTGLFYPADDTVAIATGGSERVRVSTTGLSVGGSATERIQVNSESTGGWRSVISGASAFMRFYIDRSRGTNASPSVVSDGDTVGDLVFRAHDGTTYIDAALIRVAVDGAAGASDMPGRIQFHTTVDGTTSLTERMRIDNNGLITGTGTSLGAWTSWTPTLSAGWAIGNGTMTARYCQIGKIVHFRVTVTFGSTTTFGTGALAIESLPVSRITGVIPTHSALAVDTSTATRYDLSGSHTALTGVTLRYVSSGSLADVTSTVPFTWADTDVLYLNGTYEAA